MSLSYSNVNLFTFYQRVGWRGDNVWIEQTELYDKEKLINESKFDSHLKNKEIRSKMKELKEETERLRCILETERKHSVELRKLFETKVENHNRRDNQR